MIFISELAYSLHLGSNKNRKNSVRNSAKNNVSGTTSMTIMEYKMKKLYQNVNIT